MKKIFTMAVLMAIAITASALPFNQARSEALFLSDKMAHELGLSGTQYQAVYEINLDYLLSVNNQSGVSGTYWARRNADLRYVLTGYQYEHYQNTSYFYRPLIWYHGNFRFMVYNRYKNRNQFLVGKPSVYNSYRGGNNKHHNSAYQGRNFNPPTPGNSYHGNHHNGGTKPNGNVKPGGSTKPHAGTGNSFDHNMNGNRPHANGGKPSGGHNSGSHSGHNNGSHSGSHSGSHRK